MKKPAMVTSYGHSIARALTHDLTGWLYAEYRIIKYRTSELQ